LLVIQSGVKENCFLKVYRLTSLLTRETRKNTSLSKQTLAYRKCKQTLKWVSKYQ